MRPACAQGTVRRFVAELSWNCAIRNHLEEDRPRFRWRIRLPTVTSVKMFQFPGWPVLKRFFEAVSRSHDGTGRHRFRMCAIRSGQAALSQHWLNAIAKLYSGAIKSPINGAGLAGTIARLPKLSLKNSRGCCLLLCIRSRPIG